MEEVDKSSDGAKAVIFKRREKGSNMRLKTKVIDAADEDEPTDLAESILRRESLLERQQLKLLKARGLGIEIGNYIPTASSSSDNNGGKKRDVKAAMDKQFSSHIDHGLGVTIAHEKIMDSYVNEKLGIGKEIVKQEKRIHPMDELYKVPAELKVESQNAAESKSIRIREADEGPANSWSTGIAEVSLPEVFRQRNIAATEAAAEQRRQEDQERNRLLQQQNGNNIYHRFQLQDEELVAFKHLVRSGQSAANGVPTNESNSNVSKIIGSKRTAKELKSTDDAVMKRFRQQQSNRRR